MKSAFGTKHRARLELAKFNGERKSSMCSEDQSTAISPSYGHISALVTQRFHLAIVIPTQSVLRDACAKK
jgi:hypothetical protein